MLISSKLLVPDCSLLSLYFILPNYNFLLLTSRQKFLKLVQLINSFSLSPYFSTFMLYLSSIMLSILSLSLSSYLIFWNVYLFLDFMYLYRDLAEISYWFLAVAFEFPFLCLYISKWRLITQCWKVNLPIIYILINLYIV